jgi:hypothetical protein
MAILGLTFPVGVDVVGDDEGFALGVDVGSLVGGWEVGCMMGRGWVYGLDCSLKSQVD